MASIRATNPLKAEFAALKGEYFSIEREAEDVSGREALLDKINEIARRQHKIIEKMNALKDTIHMFEPDWDHERVTPVVRRKPNKRQKGELSRSVNQVLRNQSEPLTVAEITSAVISDWDKRGVPHSKDETISVSIRATLFELEKKGRAIKLSEDHVKWALVRRAER